MLYAAVATENVAMVRLHDLGPSFETMATTETYQYDPRLTVYDVVGNCDVPQCLSALDARDVHVESDSYQ